MKKFVLRILSVLVVSVLLLGVMAGCSKKNTEDYVDEQGVLYVYHGYGGTRSDGSMIDLSGYAVAKDQTTTTANIVIPAEVNGSPVIALQNGAFSGNTTLETLELPDSMQVFGGLYNCTALKKVNIPGGLDTFGMGTLEGCTALTEVTFGDGFALETLPRGMFKNCESLEQITLPTGLTELEYELFFGCRSLRSITIPSGVTKINGSFSYCTSLETVTFQMPSALETIENGAFSQCYSLKSIELPARLKKLGGFNASGLVEIEIPSSVEKIEAFAFANCEQLEYVEFGNANSLKTIGSSAFQRCSKLLTLGLPEGLTTIEQGAFQYCSTMLWASIPQTVTSIADGAFYGCHMIVVRNSSPVDYSFVGDTKVLSGVISSMSKYMLVDEDQKVAFSIDEKTEELCLERYWGDESVVVLPEIKDENGRVRSYTLGSHIFAPNAPVFTVVLSKHVTGVKSNSFQDYPRLMEVLISESVTIEETYLQFWDVERIERVPLAEDYTSYVTITDELAYYRNPAEDRAMLLAYYKNQKEVVLPELLGEVVYDIASDAFDGCYRIESLQIPDGVNTVGTNAFGDCDNLEYTITEEGLGYLGNASNPYLILAKCFTVNVYSDGRVEYSELGGIGEGTKIFTEYSVHADTKVIYGGVFANLTDRGVTKISLPQGLTQIGANAFSNCTELRDITLPDGLLAIGERAFENCRALPKLTIPKSAKDIDYNAFAGCSWEYIPPESAEE